MNIQLERIDNGFLVTMGNKKTFCSSVESVCGLLAEWAMPLCESLEKNYDAQLSGDSAKMGLAEYNAQWSAAQAALVQAHAQLAGEHTQMNTKLVRIERTKPLTRGKIRDLLGWF